MLTISNLTRCKYSMWFYYTSNYFWILDLFTFSLSVYTKYVFLMIISDAFYTKLFIFMRPKNFFFLSIGRAGGMSLTQDQDLSSFMGFFCFLITLWFVRLRSQVPLSSGFCSLWWWPQTGGEVEKDCVCVRWFNNQSTVKHSQIRVHVLPYLVLVSRVKFIPWLWVVGLVPAEDTEKIKWLNLMKS